jgi:aryl-alcohol dehydrogenase-like predicted oxidoreductase
MRELMNERVLSAVEGLKGVACDLGLSMSQLALAWVLRRENVSSAIVGASRPEQVEDNAAASGVELPPEALGRIDGILRDVIQTGA